MKNMSSQRIIILDGPDGCGKTNIANRLTDFTGTPVFKNEGEWENFSEKDNGFFKNCLAYSHTHLLDFLSRTGYSVIFDRAYPSEFVYSAVFNRETDEAALRWCDQKCADMGAKIIVPFRTSYETVIDQFDFVSEDILLKVHDKYLEFLDWTKCETLHLNVDDEDLGREIDEILPFLLG